MSEHDDSPRDLAFEALVDALGAARLANDYSLYLLLSRVMEARENGTLGRWAVELEQADDTLRRSNILIA